MRTGGKRKEERKGRRKNKRGIGGKRERMGEEENEREGTGGETKKGK